MLARVLTAAVGIPLLTYVALAESLWPVRIFVLALGILAFVELAVAERVVRSPWAWVVPVAFCLAALTWTPRLSFLPVLLTGLLLAMVLSRRSLAARTKVAALQLIWIALPLITVIQLRTLDLPKDGNALSLATGTALMLLLLCLWAGDTVAFLIGKRFGSHPLAPTVSPSKTWEGAWANLAASLLAGALTAPPLGMRWELGLTVGALVGVFGQVGDLFQSSWKRSLGLKDSAALLPGHGGVLDRFDSMLFSVPPATALYLSGYLN